MRNLLKALQAKVHPQTIISGDKRQTYFDTVNRDLQKYENIYRAGGLVSQAIDAYPLFALSGGYIFEGPQAEVERIKAWFYKIDINRLMWQAWVDSLVYGDAIQENVYSRKGEILYIVPRNPKFFTINFDEWGVIQSYTQRVNDKETKLEPKQVTGLTLLSLSGEPYGVSLIGRAFDDIKRDTKTAESTAIAIKRHGFPRFHIKCGSEDTEYSDPAKEEIAREFEKLEADNEFISNPDIEIVAIDQGGVGKIDAYNEWSLSRLLGALGVPSQIIGTGESTTTYATASVEMAAFYKRVEAMQLKLARCYNGLIDLKTGVPGQVKIIFNPISKEGLAETEDGEE